MKVNSKRVFNFLDTIFQSLTLMAFPPQCLHCKKSLPSHQFLCQNCLSLLEFIQAHERCPFCFSFEFDQELNTCEICKLKDHLLNRVASAFDFDGPASSLIKQLKYADRPYLAEGLGGYLAAQFIELEWPMPDIIVPVPITFTHWLQRGYNQSLLIAESFAKIINKPVCDILYRPSGEFSQAGLNKMQRKRLGNGKIQLTGNQNLQDKCILIIDDVLTTGTTLNKCAEALIAGYPHSIYGLTVCRAIK